MAVEKHTPNKDAKKPRGKTPTRIQMQATSAEKANILLRRAIYRVTEGDGQRMHTQPDKVVSKQVITEYTDLEEPRLATEPDKMRHTMINIYS